MGILRLPTGEDINIESASSTNAYRLLTGLIVIVADEGRAAPLLLFPLATVA